MPDTKTIRITFMDGEVILLQMEPKENANLIGAGKLKEMLTSGSITAVIEGVLTIYPLQNIRSVEVSPIEAKTVPPFVLGACSKI